MTHILAFAPRVGTPLRLVIEDRCSPTILERITREFESYLKRAADRIAADFPAAAADMVQEARIALWELDLGRFTQRDVPYLKRILFNRMIDVYGNECRGGLTSGWPTRSLWLLEEPVVKP